MGRLRQSDLRAILAFLEEGAAVAELDAFPAFVVSRLPAVVPCDSVSYNEVDPEVPRLVSLLEPADLRFPGDAELWERYMHEHPLVTNFRRSGDGRAYKISDFLTQQAYRRLPLYTDLYRRLRTEYQIVFSLPAPPPLIVGIALNRERRDFSEREREVLNVVRPHLAEAYRNAQRRSSLGQTVAALERALDSDGRPVVALGADGGVELVSERAAVLLEAYLGPAPPGGVPVALRDWVGGPTQPSEPLVVDREGGRLVVRFLPGLEPGAHDLLVLDETVADGLTRREREVLERVAEGRTNAQIGHDLGVSERTVEKHLEHVFAKLGVPTRTAAVARVFGAR